MAHFQRNVYEQEIDLALIARENLPTQVYEYIFRDYNYEINEGYGPENELPQAEN